MAYTFIDYKLTPIFSHVSLTQQPLSQAPALMQEASQDADRANMFMRMFYLLQGTKQDEFSLVMQEKALKLRQVYKIFLPKQAIDHPKLKLLAINAPGDMRENLPIDYLLENLNFELQILYLLPHQPIPQVIPDHDVAVVAMGQSNNNKPLLQAFEKVFDEWPRPLINRPQFILNCARDTSATLLANVPNLVIAQNKKTHRADLKEINFPYTIRPLDSHAGADFCLLKSEAELEPYLKGKEDLFFFTGQFIDYKSNDGFFRKFRVALIKGIPYVCHLAISEDWVVHYLKSGMHLDQSKREEEEKFMDNFLHTIAIPYARVFETIYERIPLEYMVLDCAIDRNDNLVVFELDNSGWVHDTDPVLLYPYKKRIMQKVFNAFEELVLDKLSFQRS